MAKVSTVKLGEAPDRLNTRQCSCAKEETRGQPVRGPLSFDFLETEVKIIDLVERVATATEGPKVPAAVM